MALPTYVAAGTLAFAASNASITVPLPSGWAADDVALLLYEASSITVAQTISGWTEMPDSGQGSGTGTTGTGLRVFWRRLQAGDTDVTFTVVGSGNHAICQIIAFRGCPTTGDPWDVTAGDAEATASTSASIPGDTTTVADCLIVAICSSGADTTTPQFSSWANASLANLTERVDSFDIQGNGGGFGAATGEKASAGAYSATTATLATSFVQGRISIALMGIVSGGVTVTPTTVSLATATFISLVTTTAHQTVIPASVALALTAFASTATASDHQAVTPTTASLSVALFAPTVTATDHVTVTPDVASLTTATFAPVISATAHVTVTPDVANLTLTAFAPTVSADASVTVTPDALSLSLSTFAPTVTAGAGLTLVPSTASLATSTFAPTVTLTAHVTVTPATASLTLATEAPTVTTPVSVIPATATLTLTAFTPTVAVPVAVTPTIASLSLASFAPTVAMTANVLVTPAPLALATSALAPDVVATAHVLAIPDAALLVLTGLVPTATVGAASQPGTVTLEEIIRDTVVIATGPGDSVTLVASGLGSVELS